MSQNPRNRHKRQRSSANPQQFHFDDDDDHPFHSLLPLPDEGSSAQLLRSQQRNLHDLPPPSERYSSQPPPSTHGRLFPPPDHPHASHLQHSEPPPDFNPAPQQFPFAGPFNVHQGDMPAPQSQFLPQSEMAASQMARPPVPAWTSAPEVFGHHKNISISTQFDMFSLGEQSPYDTAPAAPAGRIPPSQPHFALSESFPYSSRQPGGPQLRVPSSGFHQLAPATLTDTQTKTPTGHQLEDHDTEHYVAGPGEPMLRRFLPNIVKIDAFNLNSFLLEILSEIGTLPPLDDFYNLLYNEKNYSPDFLQLSEQEKIDKSAQSVNPEAMEVLHQILEIFRDPQTLLSYFPTMDVSSSKLSSVNIHELLRSFLALKILYDSLIQVDEIPSSSESPATIPRHSIYKVYYIICQKLILKYPTDSNSTSLQQKLILGSSKLGKLIKLVYPTLTSKRLGRRGASKYNYMGVKWNPSIVSEEILGLCEEDLSRLADIFKNMKKSMDQQRKRSSVPRQSISSGRRSSHHRRQSTVSTGFQYMPSTADHTHLRPQVTFVQGSTKFPREGLSPLSLVTDPDNVDPRASWLGASRHHSLMALQDFNIDSQTIHSVLLNTERMANDNSWLYSEVASKVETIVRSEFREDKEYLHLFLALAIDLLPSVLIYEHSGEKSRQIQSIRQNLKHLIVHLRSRFAGSTVVDQGDISAFVGLVKRMAHLTELLESLCRSDLDTGLLQSMGNDVDRLLLSNEDYPSTGGGLISSSRFTFTQGIVRTLNAYQILENDDGKVMPPEKVIEVVSNDAAACKENLRRALKRLIEDTASGIENGPTMSLEDVSSQISIGLVELIHTDILTEKLAQHYPAFVLREMATYISNQLLTNVYESRFVGGPGVPNETFRYWWLIATFVQEYVALLSEIVGLHESLT